MHKAIKLTDVFDISYLFLKVPKMFFELFQWFCAGLRSLLQNISDHHEDQGTHYCLKTVHDTGLKRILWGVHNKENKK